MAFGILTDTGLLADDVPSLKLSPLRDTVAPAKFAPGHLPWRFVIGH